jgi:hypothetical protein
VSGANGAFGKIKVVKWVTQYYYQIQLLN